METAEKPKNRKHSRRRVLRWLLLIAAASLVCIAVIYLLWKQGAFLPRWISWENKEEEHTFTVDIDYQKKIRAMGRTGQWPEKNPEEEGNTVTESAAISLHKKCFILSDSTGKEFFRSEDGWRVSDYIVGDIDHDEEDEIVLLVWKIGSYGHFKPIWVAEDDNRWTQHIFIYDYDPTNETRMSALWKSSEMGIEAAGFSLDEDEKLHIITPEGDDTVWYWDRWGLTLVE